MAIELPPPPKRQVPKEKAANAAPLNVDPDRLQYHRIDTTILGYYFYVTRITMGGSDVSAWLFLMHDHKITTDVFQKHIDEACNVVHECRVQKRRQGLAGTQVPDLSKLPEVNEGYFEHDIVFLEGVLCDRFGYKLMKPFELPGGSVQRTIVAG